MILKLQKLVEKVFLITDRLVKAAQKTPGKVIKRARVEEKQVLLPPPPYDFLVECPPVSAQDL